MTCVTDVSQERAGIKDEKKLLRRIVFMEIKLYFYNVMENKADILLR